MHEKVLERGNVLFVFLRRRVTQKTCYVGEIENRRVSSDEVTVPRRKAAAIYLLGNCAEIKLFSLIEEEYIVKNSINSLFFFSSDKSNSIGVKLSFCCLDSIP